MGVERYSKWGTASGSAKNPPCALLLPIFSMITSWVGSEPAGSIVWWCHRSRWKLMDFTFHHPFTILSSSFHHPFIILSPSFHHPFTILSPSFHHLAYYAWLQFLKKGDHIYHSIHILDCSPAHIASQHQDHHISSLPWHRWYSDISETGFQYPKIFPRWQGWNRETMWN